MPTGSDRAGGPFPWTDTCTVKASRSPTYLVEKRPRAEMIGQDDASIVPGDVAPVYTWGHSPNGHLGPLLGQRVADISV
jgi:hypothetical protein